jgi:Zn-dependent peptidase ImmA (M78 family)
VGGRSAKAHSGQPFVGERLRPRLLGIPEGGLRDTPVALRGSSRRLGHGCGYPGLNRVQNHERAEAPLVAERLVALLLCTMALLPRKMGSQTRARRTAGSGFDASQLTLNVGLEPIGMTEQRPVKIAGHYRRLASASVSDRRDVAEVADRTWSLFQGSNPNNDSNGALVRIRAEVVKEDDDPRSAARRLRSHLGYNPQDPIPNVVRVAERLGILVGYLPQRGTISAYSCWLDDTPIILIRTMTSGRRRVRFDTSHEIAHLLLHQGMAATRTMEVEANSFAGSLLLPEGSAIATLGPPLDWGRVFDLSDLYGVSVAAMLFRLHELRVIGPVVYRAAMAHIARKGWRRSDPRDIEPTERGEQLPQAAERYLTNSAAVTDPLARCAREVLDLSRSTTSS